MQEFSPARPTKGKQNKHKEHKPNTHKTGQWKLAKNSCIGFMQTLGHQVHQIGLVVSSNLDVQPSHSYLIQNRSYGFDIIFTIFQSLRQFLAYLCGSWAWPKVSNDVQQWKCNLQLAETQLSVHFLLPSVSGNDLVFSHVLVRTRHIPGPLWCLFPNLIPDLTLEV